MSHLNLPAIAAAAVASERATGFPAEIIAAQCALESAWLTKMSGECNAFGIKATGDDPGKLVWTLEWFTAEELARFLRGNERRSATPTGKSDGVRKQYRVADYFRSYNSLAECFADHARLVTQGAPYREAWEAFEHDRDVSRLIDGIAKRYATAPDYALKVKQIAAQANVQAALRKAREA